jgi:hypothetical protein
MKTHVLAILAVVFASGTAFAVPVRFDCKAPKSSVPYTAEIVNDETMNRSVQITFARRISIAEATAVVQACVKEAALRNPSLDVLGSAWIGNKAVELSKGRYYVYFTRSKVFRFM